MEAGTEILLKFVGFFLLSFEPVSEKSKRAQILRQKLYPFRFCIPTKKDIERESNGSLFMIQKCSREIESFYEEGILFIQYVQSFERRESFVETISEEIS